MWQFMVASLSPDATILSSASIVTAIGLRCYHEPKWVTRDVIAMAIGGTLLCVIKPVYLPLLVLGLPAALPSPQDSLNASRKKVMLAVFHTIIVATVLVIAIAWLYSNASVFTSAAPDPAVEGSGIGQTQFIASHPLGFVQVLVRTLARDGGVYIRQGIGVLGWLNLPLPTWLYVTAISAFLLGALMPADSQSLPWWILVWAALLVVASAVLVEIALYIAWTGVGAAVIEGVQGRYFLPMLPLAGVVIASTMTATHRDKTAAFAYPIAAAACVLMTLGTLWVVVAQYRVFY
jgi:uncharacterized membrane protein